AELEAIAGARIVSTEEVAWDAQAGAVRARRRRLLDALVLEEAPLADADPALVARGLCAGLRSRGLDALPWTPAARNLQARAVLMATLEPGWPDLADAALAATLEDWLAPHLAGLCSLAELGRLDLVAILRGVLGPQRAAALDAALPSHLALPQGRAAIDYARDPPTLAARAQALFGLAETPRLAGGRVRLQIELLSPAGRPIAVTGDLAAFWRGGWAEVRKAMRGRYPRHAWPEDPMAGPARATRP
ncbi:ATP-dependent helicase HrpB, partial [Elioraea sp. Yellowstone]|uniref:ATP-dependent helicase C-terminal domain-containing protein n=1 Tax=Elioraea sp. Yellowstone TaxID=2592070 RepID=UPI001167A097